LQRLRRLLTSASFRLAVLQTALFLIAFTAAGVTAFVVIRRAEYRAAHAEIEEYEDDVTDLLTQRGVAALVAKAVSRHHDNGRDFRLQDAGGHLLAGGLPAPPMPARMSGATPRKFWSTYMATDPPGGRVLAFTRPEAGGMRVTVGEYLAVRERQDDPLLFGLVGLAGLAAGVGLAGGAIVGGTVLRRLDQMARTVDDYANGERTVRIALGKGARSDHAHLASAINSMMDRENRLIEGLRQVSSAIAHDLRRPLAHHNQEIATALAASGSADHYKAALVAASDRVDEVLQTFQALLHIAELEAGAPGLRLEVVELDRVAAKIVEAYGPSAEGGGRRLALSITGERAHVIGEPRVLGRVIANLIENALTYTPEGSIVRVVVDGGTGRLTVADDGPGVPEAALSRIFDRFFRLDASRSTAGSGLGLSLAAAATRAFGGRMWAEDAGPGLRIVAAFKKAEEV
jgi:signal transduction histidine kinase